MPLKPGDSLNRSLFRDQIVQPSAKKSSNLYQIANVTIVRSLNRLKSEKPWRFNVSRLPKTMKYWKKTKTEPL